MSIGFLVSDAVCDVVVLGAAIAQAISDMTEHKTEIKKNVETCLGPKNLYFLKNR